jgi:hypothetical protein
MPWGDGPFQIIKKINGNPYTMDLPCEYGVSATFNIDDLFFFLCRRWFEVESFLGEREWYDPSNTNGSIEGSSWCSDKA